MAPLPSPSSQRTRAPANGYKRMFPREGVPALKGSQFLLVSSVRLVAKGVPRNLAGFSVGRLRDFHGVIMLSKL